MFWMAKGMQKGFIFLNDVHSDSTAVAKVSMPPMAVPAGRQEAIKKADHLQASKWYTEVANVSMPPMAMPAAGQTWALMQLEQGSTAEASSQSSHAFPSRCSSQWLMGQAALDAPIRMPQRERSRSFSSGPSQGRPASASACLPATIMYLQELGARIARALAAVVS